MQKSFSKARAIVALFASAAFGLGIMSSSAKATVVNWDGDMSTAWATAGNWDTLPTNDTTTDIARFDIVDYTTPFFAPNAGTTSIAGVQIGSTSGAVTLATSNLTIGLSGISMESGAAAVTIGKITADVDQTWTNNSVNTLTVSGANVYTGHVTFAGSGRINAGGTSTGAGGVTIDGATVTHSGTTTQFGTGLLEFKSGGLLPKIHTT